MGGALIEYQKVVRVWYIEVLVRTVGPETASPIPSSLLNKKISLKKLDMILEAQQKRMTMTMLLLLLLLLLKKRTS